MAVNKPICLAFYDEAIRCVRPATKEGRCDAHQLPAFRKNNRSARLPVGWNHIRANAFAVYGDICYLCGKPGADSIEHIVPNDDNSIENLRPAHQNVEPYCHRTKTAYEGHEAKKAQAPAEYGTRWTESDYIPLKEE